MTAKLIVILQTPARNAEAPTMAKIPGEIVVPPAHWPKSRPKNAPPSKAGMMIPEGTLTPNVMVVKINFTKVPYPSQP